MNNTNLMFQVMDIRDARIESLLQDIINTNLCEVPGDEPWTVEHFEKRTSVRFNCFHKTFLLALSYLFIYVNHQI